MQNIIIDSNMCSCITVECVQQALMFISDYKITAQHLDLLVNKMHPNITLHESLQDVLHIIQESSLPEGKIHNDLSGTVTNSRMLKKLVERGLHQQPFKNDSLGDDLGIESM